jgi:PAS domain S-box-containing protein
MRRLRQLWRQWWSSQPPVHQDRVAMLAPLAAVLIFLAAIVAAFSYLRIEEVAREREAIGRDVEYTHQRLRLRLLEQQEHLMRLAREVSSRELSDSDFMNRSEAFANEYPELLGLSWVDERKRLRLNYDTSSLSPRRRLRGNEWLDSADMVEGYRLARELLTPLYASPQTEGDNAGQIRLFLPLLDKSHFKGVLVVTYSIDGIFRYGVPPEMTSKYALSFLDSKGKLLAGQSIKEVKLGRRLLPWEAPVNTYEAPLNPVGQGVVLRGQAYRASAGVIGSALFWLVMVLSAVTVWLLVANWRHTRRRIRAQEALIQETAFRRAMEESMLTGMRAMDLQGRITYVNSAFCRMTGWKEEELVGKLAPFPYWPEEDADLLKRTLQDELSGKVQPSGIQFRLKRPDGSTIDARLYVSPLIDAYGHQTGWMTSMTDITEPNRVREQLAASHERFTAVLEALDASISVAPLGSEELLFANKLYRQWFGTQAQGHLALITQAGTPNVAASDEVADTVDAFAGLPTDELSEKDTESAEIYIPSLSRWLEVRTRYLSWVDGRLAQMVIATDITPRRLAEEQSDLQAQRAQASSRLITMGEMASSVAHELNQPLTAINNYCNGMVSRIQAGQITQDELLGALEKTARQASRAGQIIHRIRSFVKRSEPNRTWSSVATMVSEAVELAEIELRRRNVRLVNYVTPGLPHLHVDPILIEQVLLNLLKNAAESIDAAQRPSAERMVKLRVEPTRVDDKAVVEFTVGDTGRGLSPEVMARLYEAFYSTKAEGMGIGLSLCRSIVESHLGRMKAENLYNEKSVVGCVFSFWIPITTPAVGAPVARFDD